MFLISYDMLYHGLINIMKYLWGLPSAFMNSISVHLSATTTTWYLWSIQCSYCGINKSPTNETSWSVKALSQKFLFHSEFSSCFTTSKCITVWGERLRKPCTQVVDTIFCRQMKDLSWYGCCDFMLKTLVLHSKSTEGIVQDLSRWCRLGPSAWSRWLRWQFGCNVANQRRKDLYPKTQE